MDNLGQLLKGNTDLLILSLLSQRDMYGYELIKELDRRSDGVFSIGQGTLYPALHRLERAGLVRGRWRRATKTQQPRRYYSTTPKGVAWLGDHSTAWQRFAAAVDNVLRAG